MKILLSVLLILAALYVLALRGRSSHPGLEKLRGWNYAHRGLHGGGVPENSMQAFRMALDAGYGAELDVHLLKDGTLAVIHDSALVRTTGAGGRIEDLTMEQLSDYKLEGTEETIPTFRAVLDLFEEKAPLIIELKAENNAAALCEAVCSMLADYKGVYCLESFDPRCLMWLKKNQPDLIRGQLASNFLHDEKVKLPGVLRFALTYYLVNFLTVPDFIAYDFKDRNTLSNRIIRKLWRVQGVSWTLRSQADHNTAVKEGWIPIFEYYRP